MLLLVVLVAQVLPSHGSMGRPVVPLNVRCVADSFGNYACSDGSRILLDSRGGFTVIPGRR
jgi:hypothetical protein